MKDTTTCQWFLMCDRPAVTTVKHPVLGDVPCCQRCADFAEPKRCIHGDLIERCRGEIDDYRHDV